MFGVGTVLCFLDNWLFGNDTILNITTKFVYQFCANLHENVDNESSSTYGCGYNYSYIRLLFFSVRKVLLGLATCFLYDSTVKINIKNWNWLAQTHYLCSKLEIAIRWDFSLSDQLVETEPGR